MRQDRFPRRSGLRVQRCQDQTYIDQPYSVYPKPRILRGRSWKNVCVSHALDRSVFQNSERGRTSLDFVNDGVSETTTGGVRYLLLLLIIIFAFLFRRDERRCLIIVLDAPQHFLVLV